MKENKDQQPDNRTSQNDETKIYLTRDSSLQTPEEDAHDKNVDPAKGNEMDVSNDDLRETNADRFAASDRAGIAERMDNEMKSDKE